MPIGTDPIATGGAVGDLGLSAAAKADAADIAEKMRKKKLQDSQAVSQAGSAAANPVSAVQQLFGGV